jgi:hypothetical protein
MPDIAERVDDGAKKSTHRMRQIQYHPYGAQHEEKECNERLTFVQTRSSTHTRFFFEMACFAVYRCSTCVPRRVRFCFRSFTRSGGNTSGVCTGKRVRKRK